MSRNKIHEVSSLYRTFSPDINTYHQLGNGRDSYISYNNGGFWNIDLKPKSEYQNNYYLSRSNSSKYKIKFSTRKPVPFRFRSEGKGRDGYIIYACGNNIENPPLKQLSLEHFLRTNDDNFTNYNYKFKYKNKKFRPKLSNAEYKILCKRREIEKKLIDRLYTKEIEKIKIKNKNKIKEIDINNFFIRKDSDNNFTNLNKNKNSFKRVFSSGNINENNNNNEKNFPSIIKNINNYNSNNNTTNNKKYMLKDLNYVTTYNNNNNLNNNNINNYQNNNNNYNENFQSTYTEKKFYKNNLNNSNANDYQNIIIKNNYKRTNLYCKNTQSSPNMKFNEYY